MAGFIMRNTSALSYAQGFTQWHYRAEGGEAGLYEATQPGFFATFLSALGEKGGMDPGDVVLITNGSGAREVVILDGGAVALLRRAA